MSKYTVRTVKNSRIDPETGEIREYTDRVEVFAKEAEPFFLTYSKEILALYGKPIFNATTKVLWKLLEFAEYNTGKVYITTERRKDIMEICNISRASYDRAIADLAKEGIISRDGNTYTFASNMFWKGDRDERKRLLNAKLMVTFSPVFNTNEQVHEADK